MRPKAKPAYFCILETIYTLLLQMFRGIVASMDYLSVQVESTSTVYTSVIMLLIVVMRVMKLTARTVRYQFESYIVVMTLVDVNS